MPQPKPWVFIFMGLIASGKSTLAKAFAGKYQLAYYNSDIERKKLARIDPTRRGDGKFGVGVYTPEMTRMTYDTLIARSKELLAQNRSVVLDGSYTKESERQLIQDALAGTEASIIFILCTVSEEITMERLRIRALDKTAVSDGTLAIYLRQKQDFEYPDELDPAEFISIETDGGVEQLLTSLASSLNIPPFRPNPDTIA